MACNPTAVPTPVLPPTPSISSVCKSYVCVCVCVSMFPLVCPISRTATQRDRGEGLKIRQVISECGLLLGYGLSITARWASGPLQGGREDWTMVAQEHAA